MNTKIENLRALAIILVVLGHSIIIYDSSWSTAMGIDTAVSSPLLCWLKHCINLIQMPLFFSISGFCFYFSIKKLDGSSEF